MAQVTETLPITDPKRLPESWRPALASAVRTPAMQALAAYLEDRKAAGARICPSEQDYFRALELTPLDRVRAVILGQDPYHQPGRAHGLSFSMRSVPRDSLLNIFKEVHRDLGIPPASHGNLEPWARRGVLLLNTILTVEEGKPKYHIGQGWEPFTDAVIEAVARKADPVVFMLWGGPAKDKAPMIRETDEARRHCILETSHPSGLGAWQGFRGCGHFSEANRFLGRNAIDWALPPSP